MKPSYVIMLLAVSPNEAANEDSKKEANLLHQSINLDKAAS